MSIQGTLLPAARATSRLVQPTRGPRFRVQIRRSHDSAPKPKSQPLPSSSRVQRYMPRLQDLSKRTGVPLSSLAVSFMILHELTAVLPVIGFYFLFSSLGTGLGIVQWLDQTTGIDEQGTTHETNGWRGWVKGWYDEGQGKMERVGKRYGLWKDDDTERGVVTAGGQKAGEGVANAIAAYVVVKALLPLRIGVSLGAAPVFARWALEPIRNLGKRWIRRK